MNPGIDQTTIVIILWGAAALVLAWTWVPALISSLGGTRYLNGWSNDTSMMAPSEREPDYSFWAEQLLAMGYEPLGSGWVRINFAGKEWAIFASVRVFKNASKNCYAYMERAPAPFFFWPGAIFATCFPDGQLLITDNNRDAQPDPDDLYIRQGMVTLNLVDTETYHLATLAALRQLARKPDPDMSMDTLMHSLAKHDGAEARSVHSRASTQYLFAHGLIHICISIPTGYLLGLMNWSVPLSNLVLALVMLMGESSQKRQYARAVRAAMRMRQMAPKKASGEPGGLAANR